MPSRFTSADKSKDFPGLWQVAVALVIAGQAMLLSLGLNTTEDPPIFGSSIYIILHGILISSSLIVLILLGGPLWRNFIKNLRARRVTIESLFIVTLIGALGVSLQCSLTGAGHIYYETVAVVLVIYTFGNTLKANATREAEKILAASRAAYAQAWVYKDNYLTNNSLNNDKYNNLTKKNVSDLRVDELIVVKPGEMIPVDGVIIQGQAFITQASLTGEPTPVAVGVGDHVQAGAFSIDGLLTIKVTTTARTIDAIFNNLENVAPSQYEQLADRVIRWFLPVVAVIALVTFLFWSFHVGLSLALAHSMSVLLIACPCALGIATPLGVRSFLYALSRYGWRGRSGQLIERLAACDTIFFDKTGTLTLADLKICSEDITPVDNLSADEIRGLIALCQQSVSHPIAQAFYSWPVLPGSRIENLRVLPGEGLSAEIHYANDKNKDISLNIGSYEFLNRLKIPLPNIPAQKTIFVSVNKTYAGSITLAESPRPQIFQMLEELLAQGKQVEILTGDMHPQITFDPRVSVHAGLSPHQKAARVTDAQQKENKRVLFIGDGINDTLAMKEAFCSLAVGEGAPLGHAASMAVVQGEGLLGLPQALTLAQRARGVLAWNLQFAALYNFIGITLAAAGLLHPVAASLLMLASSIVVAWRALDAAHTYGEQSSAGGSSS